MPRTLFDFFSPKTTKGSITKDSTASQNTPLKPYNKICIDKEDAKVNTIKSSDVSATKEARESVAAKCDVESDMDQSEDEIKSHRKPSKKMAKKRRCIESSSSDNAESGDEFVPGGEESSEDDYESEASSNMESDSCTSETPKRASRKRKRTGQVSSASFQATPTSSISSGSNSKNGRGTPIAKSPSLSVHTKSRLSFFEASNECDDSYTDPDNQTKYLHETLDFLFPDKIQDKNGNKANDPSYDPTTLKIPGEFLRKLSPAMLQWWKMKSENYDVILCFKVGKFYELYHMDAVVGVNELGLVYMKGNFAHSGFPEIAFGRYSDILVNKGYKIARVEQTETPEQNAIRIKRYAVPKQERTLRREICRIVTKGTQCLGSQSTCANMQSGSNFLLAVTERQLDNDFEQAEAGKLDLHREFGVCFVDTSVGIFYVGQFPDDRHSSSLCTMLCRNTPCQVLYERGRVSSVFQKILKSGLSSIMQEPLNSGSQFWSSAKTISHLRKEEYFTKDGEEKWPDVLKKMMKDPDAVSLCASRDYELAISALGACIFYLQKCLFDREVLSLGHFVEYKPHVAQVCLSKNIIPDFVKNNGKMVLDSVTLTNLEILENSVGGTEGTLLNRLDNCYTPFGKRLLKQWLCAPPCNPEIAIDRLDAIEDLIESAGFVEEARAVMKVMPDLERMLMKIHALSKGSRNQNHPENRAIFYEEVKYSKKSIEEFLAILRHYESFLQLLKKYQGIFVNFKSKSLKRHLCFSDNSGNFPDLKEVLDHWKSAFNHKKALETGKITPNKGANPDFDDAIDAINRINADLELYLKDQKKKLQCSTIVYKGTGNKRYQLEMPVEVANRLQSSRYVITGQRKGYKSFRTPETAEFLKNMEKAESQRDSAQADTLAIIFREFDQDHDAWRQAIESFSVIDVLISLMQYSRNSESEMCRPTFCWSGPSMPPFVEIRDGKHPSMSRTFFDDEFISNDTALGNSNDEESPSCLVLTGPNMGGKSTLMRQVGLIVVLAHLGCQVPASSCMLSPVDRVFTRLGASDRILSGESTFHVEMSETSSILRHATKHSLVLLDELGRGTATYDGTAIAAAVIQEISSNIKCRTIFSTHYHSVVDDLKSSKDVIQGHMACMVENEDTGEGSSRENLTFLYKLSDGPCPKSYGFHAARLAGLPESVISLACRKALELEKNTNNMVAYRKFYNLYDLSEVKNVLSQC